MQFIITETDMYYDMCNISTSLDNIYYPLSCFYRCDKLANEDVYLYYKPVLFSNNRIKTYKNLFKHLNYSNCVRYFNIGYKKLIYALFNTIYSMEGKPLLVLTTTSKKMFNYRKNKHAIIKDCPYLGDKIFINNNKLKLFISTELINNSMYSNLYKHLYNNYIINFHAKNISVEFTSSLNITNLVFSNGIDLNFKSLESLENHLKNEVKDILFSQGTLSIYKNNLNYE